MASTRRTPARSSRSPSHTAVATMFSKSKLVSAIFFWRKKQASPVQLPADDPDAPVQSWNQRAHPQAPFTSPSTPASINRPLTTFCPNRVRARASMTLPVCVQAAFSPVYPAASQSLLLLPRTSVDTLQALRAAGSWALQRKVCPNVLRPCSVIRTVPLLVFVCRRALRSG